jgi:hypothetical protein
MSEVGHDASASVLQRVSAVNVGLDSFADAVRAQGGEVAEVDWRPPGGGDAAIVALLERAWGSVRRAHRGGQRRGGTGDRGGAAARRDRRAGGVR